MRARWYGRTVSRRAAVAEGDLGRNRSSLLARIAR
jgi:hypothetical protein